MWLNWIAAGEEMVETGCRIDNVKMLSWISTCWEELTIRPCCRRYVDSTAILCGKWFLCSSDSICKHQVSKYYLLRSSVQYNNNNNNNNNNNKNGFLRLPSSRIWAAESARSQGIHGKRPIFSSVLQLPHNTSTPFCYETISLPMSPKMIQMPCHSSIWF